ncbi:hypothetical protein LCGC14_1669960 [marine sediment metagenome]|uniref:Uncharacterized protein n=1 Tax=marine sediment metagenome TaxID=412755 RepID=A0A0F9K7J3_9ZZZZ
MAKTQGGGGVRTEGGLDPYVAQSLTRGRAGAENRLVTAMQQEGATKRQGMASASQEKGQAVQAQVSREQMAASATQQDKTLAAQERSKREEQKFQKARDTQTEVFHTEQNRISNEFIVAERKANWDKQDDLRKEQRAYDDVRDIADRKQARENYNAYFSLIKGQLKSEAAREKAYTSISDSRDKFEKDKTVHERLVKNTVTRINEDKRMDLPVRGKFKAKAVPAGSAMGFSSGFTTTQVSAEDTQADPIGVLQSQLTANGVSFSAEDAMPENISKLEAGIAEGKIAAEDIRSSIGVYNAMLLELDKRKTSAGKEDQGFWREKYNTVEKMKRAVVGLRDSKLKVGDTSDSVAKLVAQGLEATDPIYSKGLGSWAAEMKAEFGNDYSSMLDAMTKGTEPISLFDIGPDLNKYEIAARKRSNVVMRQSYPDRFGVDFLAEANVFGRD